MLPDDTIHTISDVAPLVKRGELLPSQILGHCLTRIDRYESNIRAWAVLDRDRAYEDAERLNDEVRRGHYRGPLHGIPVGVKDIIDVSDMPTGCGSARWANSYARRDATCVRRLRDAGAIILGKTVTTPFAFLDPPVTRNPWKRDRTPGGSSSGSAAAVACGMCFAALGSQTGGSLTRPAAFCGVFSLKPTHGRVSVDGVLPLAPSLDHVGVMANGVRDLAIVFQAIAGYDPNPSSSLRRAVPDCVASIDREVAEADKKFARDGDEPRRWFQRPAEMFPDTLDPAMTAFLDQVEDRLKHLSHAQAGVSHTTMPPGFRDVHRRHRQMMAVEAARVHGERLKRHPDDYPPRIRELVTEGLTVRAIDYHDADRLRWLTDDDVWALPWPAPLLTPAALGPAPTPETTGDAWCNSPWSFFGWPTVSLPLGRSPDGLPLSVQLVGGAQKEDALLARAARMEHVFRIDGAWKPAGLPPVWEA